MGHRTPLELIREICADPINADLLTALAERNAAAIRDWDGLAAIEASTRS